MIQFQVELFDNAIDEDSIYLQGLITTECYNCSASNYLFKSNYEYDCYKCKKKLSFSHIMIEEGIGCRVKYHKTHWQKNDVEMLKQYDEYLKNKDS